MKIKLSILFILLSYTQINACTMYKITLFGKTFVGNNEDNWNPNARIWFEKGKFAEYGSVFVGSDTLYAQGGMNEKGLAFDGFSIKKLYCSKKPNKIAFYYDIVKDVLKKCQNIDEVYDMLFKYDLSIVNGAMLLFVDKTGRYLIVEPDTMIKGNDDKYLLSNFRPSTTTDLNSVPLPAYQRGRKMLNINVDTSLIYMKSLSETLCAKGMSSTIYTSIYNINEGLIYLYLYHNYKQHCTFNLKDELAKGDHVLNIASLFQPNAEYEKFRSYKTLHNDDGLLSIFIFCALLFSFSSIFFLFSFFRNRKITNETNNRYSKVKLLLSAFDVLLLYYVVTLVRNEIIFYYPIQYIASYIPFLMLLLIYSLFRWNYKSFGTQSWTKFSNWLFALNNLSYLTLLVLFFYWLSYRIF